jgi:hypothetical protein
MAIEVVINGAASASTHFVSSLVYGVKATDGFVLLGAPLSLTAVIAASSLPDATDTLIR